MVGLVAPGKVSTEEKVVLWQRERALAPKGLLRLHRDNETLLKGLRGK